MIFIIWSSACQSIDNLDIAIRIDLLEYFLPSLDTLALIFAFRFIYRLGLSFRWLLQCFSYDHFRKTF